MLTTLILTYIKGNIYSKMSREPSPEREIFKITDDELDPYEFEDTEPLHREPSKMAKLCKKLTYMVRRVPKAKYTDGL